MMKVPVTTGGKEYAKIAIQLLKTSPMVDVQEHVVNILQVNLSRWAQG